MMRIDDAKKAGPYGRFQALLLRPDGSVTHLAPRDFLQEAIDDADAHGNGTDAKVMALMPRRVVASREVGSSWIKS